MVAEIDAEESEGLSTATIEFCLTEIPSGSISIGQLSDHARLLCTERPITFLASYKLVVDSITPCDRLNEILK